MANLYRKPIVRTDPATGKKVTTKSRKWWGQFRDSTGKLRRHPLSTEKKAAQAMLNDLVRRVERVKAGPGTIFRTRCIKIFVSTNRAW